ncbi:MAG: glycosyltransferase family 4 protein [Acidobacteria bacterium]|nr:glycosyltransferase family 4 protein [Acidobacteriota bacterium]
MKILYVCADLGIPVQGGKGAAVHVRAMAHAFRDAGHSVVVAAGQTVKSLWQTPAPLDVPVLHVPPGPEIVHVSSRLRAFSAAIGAPSTAAGEVRRALYNQELLVQLRQRFEHDPPDVVYERASLFGIAGLTFAREIGVPHLLELNAPLADEQQRYRQGGALRELADTSEAWLLTGTDAVLAVSAPLADQVVARGVDRARVHVVANGVDTTRFHPGGDHGVRARYGLGDRPVLGFVGGLRPWHGVETLPRAVAALTARHPGVHALIVGDGPLRDELTREITRLGLEAHVTLTGAVPHEDVPAFIRACDVALAPYPAASHTFYFSPLKVYEYMACGVPVVGARLGQLADVVEEGVTGRLYPAGDTDALVEACHDLLARPADARRMGARAAEVIAAGHTCGHNARRIAALAATIGTREAVCA